MMKTTLILISLLDNFSPIRSLKINISRHSGGVNRHDFGNFDGRGTSCSNR